MTLTLKHHLANCGLALTLAFAALSGLASPGTASAASSPAWSVELAAYATHFIPGSAAVNGQGPSLQVLATNVGAAGTSGPFALSITLPVGAGVSSSKPIEGGFSSVNFGEKGEFTRTNMSCGAAGRVVTCEGGAPGVGPGGRVQVTVPLDLGSVGAGVVKSTATVSGGGAVPISRTVELETQVGGAAAPFELLLGPKGAGGTVTDATGAAVMQAGAHPFQYSVSFGFSTTPNEPINGFPLAAGGGVKDVNVTLPPGVVVDPAATPKCREAELESAVAGCPADTQVGVVRLSLGLAGISTSVAPLYNMVASPGSPGEFGFEVAGLQSVYAHIRGHLRSDGQYELAASVSDITAKATVAGVQTTLWGDPTAESHDAQRGACIYETSLALPSCPLAPLERQNRAFVTMPSACSGPLLTHAAVDSWVEPDTVVSAFYPSTDPAETPVGVDGCSLLGFEPSISLAPDTPEADSPSGLAVDLKVPQNQEVERAGTPVLAPSTLKDATVTLPKGVSVDPSAANGRGACTEGQIGFIPDSGRYTDEPAECPDNAKVGSVEVLTPLLRDEPGGVQIPHPLPGSIYLAQPYDNPFGSLLAIYLAIYDPATGVVVKLGGQVEADPSTGQLTTTFRENPQLPFESFRLHFFGGPRAALKTPAVCGSFASESALTPWSGTAPVSVSSAFPVTKGAGGAPCAGSEGQLPNAPSFQAGTVASQAGGYSPFVLHLTRNDGSQNFSALDVSLPEGLTGRLAGTPYCPESVIAAAGSKSGRAEQATPSCPAASEIGNVTVGAGAGTLPFYAGGRAYLAGPYKGAPLSLVIVTPAVAGPYDLGDVVVRAALVVEPFTAKITVKSDPLPTILKGIPLDIRSIAVQIDKPQFTLNPTSCEPMTLSAQVHTTAGQVADVGNRFQASGCDNLAFRPKVKLNLKGATKRTGHPALKAVVSYPQKGSYSNIARAQVGLPHSEFLDQGNLNKVCTQPELLSGSCPAKSIYGHAKAWTPLLEKPLEGPVYLAVGFGYKLPALVADLNGQVRILLKGKVDTTKRHGIRNTFEAVPDAPVSRFVLQMKGGKKYGLLENSENICRKKQRASAQFVAQSGRVLHLRPKITNSCKAGKRKGTKHRHPGKHRAKRNQ